MSANKLNENVWAFSINGYNFYRIITPEKTFVIGGVPDQYREDYIETAASADAVILLTSKPEFTGGLEAVLDRNPEIEIYAGTAGLRNIKAIVNRSINEKLIKDNMELCGIRFFVTPNLHWVDSVMAFYNGILFSGEMFSGFDGSAVGLKQEFDRRLAINKDFVLSAIKRLEHTAPDMICPAYGGICPQGTVCVSAVPEELFQIYRKWCMPCQAEPKAVVLYSSEYGFTRSLAERASEKLRESVGVLVYDVNQAEPETVIRAVNHADLLLVGTNTINRNAPRKIWDVITRIDLMNRRGTPYFVFGSFGWAGDGIKLVDKALAAMSLRQAVKPVEVLFKPSEADFEKIDKAVERILAYDDTNRKR